MWDLSDELRKKLLSKKEIKLGDLENSQPIHIVKNEDVANLLTRRLVNHLNYSQQVLFKTSSIVYNLPSL